MQASTQQKLIQLNQSFYSQFADLFSSTRERLQPGVASIAAGIPLDAILLDLGCGNGLFLAHLAKLRFQGEYFGVDFSDDLLATAHERNTHTRGVCRFDYIQGDLTQPDWVLELLPHKFDLITAFAVLHHIPGEDLHRQFFAQAAQLLKPGGTLLLSVWQFQNSPRLMSRIQPWESIGLSDEDLDEGDTLLDWRAGPDNEQVGLRYVHMFTGDDLDALAENAGFTRLSQFYSDGKPGNLALYQEWQSPLA